MKFKSLSVIFIMISVISVLGYFTSEVTASHDEARRGHTASIGYSA
ncbi:aspartate phosphatase [Bacillus pumilus]|uniref:Aspartate phosphatase n=1 Tax=Bacillus pumilus TaxID=1408 RepID=A0AAD0HM04_BACPU|nr:aspartate phosphatase [Bacillus pumilus]AVM23463.1 aspartate phosphatase [Bacillus pumilus]TYS44827.1 aspartate phosphatase [Bacillus pumilus]